MRRKRLVVVGGAPGSPPPEWPKSYVFPGTSLTGSGWEHFGPGSVAVADDLAKVSCTQAYGHPSGSPYTVFRSATRYNVNADGSYFQAEVAATPTEPATKESSLELGGPMEGEGDDMIGVFNTNPERTQFVVRNRVAGANADQYPGTRAAACPYWRLRVTTTTVIAEVSVEGTTWQALGTPITKPAWLTDVRPRFRCGHYGAGPSAGTLDVASVKLQAASL